MTKKILSVLLAVMMIVSVCTFTVSADEVVYYVEEGAAGDGTEDDPFGTIQEAILAQHRHFQACSLGRHGNN